MKASEPYDHIVISRTDYGLVRIFRWQKRQLTGIRFRAFFNRKMKPPIILDKMNPEWPDKRISPGIETEVLILKNGEVITEVKK